MIPPFESSGYLPAGIHRATIAEIQARFGGPSELRKVQMESIRWMVDLAKNAGVQRIILNGSFTTDILEPNDVDCALLISTDTTNGAADDELLEGLPFLDISLVGPVDFDYFVNRFFAADRKYNTKGMIEVVP